MLQSTSQSYAEFHDGVTLPHSEQKNMCFYLSVYPHWRSMVTKQFIAPIQGSAAAADPLEGQVPLVLDMISDGRI